MPTSRHSQLTLEITTSLPLASHASPIPKRGSGKPQTTIGTCGPNFTESFAKFDPNGLCLKMSQGYCQANLDGSLEEFSETWPKQGLMRNGQLFHAPIWAAPTGEIGSGLLPTPRSSDGKGAQTLDSAKGCLGRGFAPNLPEAVILMANGLIPTPTARDFRHGSKIHGQKRLDGNHHPSLNDFMAVQTSNSRLNPRFVEEMMGFPCGWTELNL